VRSGFEDVSGYVKHKIIASSLTMSVGINDTIIYFDNFHVHMSSDQLSIGLSNKRYFCTKFAALVQLCRATVMKLVKPEHTYFDNVEYRIAKQLTGHRIANMPVSTLGRLPSPLRRRPLNA
jgi:hypothetical protein